MDSALELKIRTSNGENLPAKEIKQYLDQSSVFQELLKDLEITSLNLLHRLIQLCEIPYSDTYEKVRTLRDKLAELTWCREGFSLTGKRDDVLACYNAMITTVLIKLNYPDTSKIDKGVDWIVKYQNTTRGLENHWTGKGILKYGGCMKSTPCFIGVVESMVTLNELVKTRQQVNQSIKDKLQSGLEYILEHNVYRRLSTENPITPYLTKLTYPYTYKTNLVEILGLLKDNDLLDDPRTGPATDLLIRKQKQDGCWRANAHYKPKFWVDFDQPRKKAHWLSHEIKAILN
jgi:hypothetical protein